MNQFLHFLYGLQHAADPAGAVKNGVILYGGSAIQTFWVCVATGAQFVWDIGMQFS
jgi:hypothetical protein